MDFNIKLVNWYHINKRDFPWRLTKDPYFIWLSEIILQQTRTTQGLPYYIKFIKQFPTIKDLAFANEKDILLLWQGLGYYSRARNLHFAAKQICIDFHGKFPDNYKDLLKLKGVGDYTASSIASICYNEKTAVVDGNVYRVLSRYFNIKTPINSSKGIKEFKNLAQELIHKNQSGTYNQAIMDFGATVCKPKKPNCESCIFNDKCLALKYKTVNELPVKTKKIKIKKRFFNYIVLLNENNETFIQKRDKKGIWQNLYQFPLVETEKKITKSNLLKSHNFTKIVDAFDYSVQQYNKQEIIHKLSHQHIYTKFWIVKIKAQLKNGIPFNKIKNYPVSTLVHNFCKGFNL